MEKQKAFFAKGTLVFTDQGYKLIEDIRAGDRVLTHIGKFKKVISLTSKTIKKCSE